MVNGKVTVSLEDNETGKKSNTGVIALQLHAGGPMKLEVKDISLVSKEKKTSKKFNTQISNNVKFLGRKSGDELAMWIASSSALIYISYFEGFGLPILEGMMAGVPVISGNLTSLPEVGGNAVIYVDPFNIKSISKGMKRQLVIFQSTEI